MSEIKRKGATISQHVQLTSVSVFIDIKIYYYF